MVGGRNQLTSHRKVRAPTRHLSMSPTNPTNEPYEQATSSTKKPIELQVDAQEHEEHNNEFHNSAWVEGESQIPNAWVSQEGGQANMRGEGHSRGFNINKIGMLASAMGHELNNQEYHHCRDFPCRHPLCPSLTRPVMLVLISTQKKSKISKLGYGGKGAS